MIIYLIVGGIVGWLASIFMRTESQGAVILNIAAGIAGALLGGGLLGPMLGGGGLIGWLGACLGAIALLGIVNLVRRIWRP